MELLIGCGSRRQKLIRYPGREEWDGLVTLDINPSHNPDVVWDLNKVPLPFEDNTFQEIHAIEVLEHMGQQGDWRFFFAQFEDFWRVLKPGGTLHFTTPHPTSPWAWGDPGHTRSLPPECLVFLSQDEYAKQVGHTAMTDYRPWYRGDFRILHLEVRDGTTFAMLEAVK